MKIRPGLYVFALFAFSFVAGCSGASSSIRKTYDDPQYADRHYSNVLVIGLSPDYNGRSRFERSMASALSTPLVSATPYYVVAEGDREITREKVVARVQEGDFDGVVVTRIASQKSGMNVRPGSSQAKVTRRNDRPVDFFRYNYEVLDEPDAIAVAVDLELISDFFDARDQKRIWSAESSVSDKENMSSRVETIAVMIAERLQSDGIVAR